MFSELLLNKLLFKLIYNAKDKEIISFNRSDIKSNI